METDLDWLYDENQFITCKNCQWSGTLKETRGKRINSSQEAWSALAGRLGFEYSCPKCGWTVERHYMKAS